MLSMYYQGSLSYENVLAKLKIHCAILLKIENKMTKSTHFFLRPFNTFAAKRLKKQNLSAKYVSKTPEY